VSSLEHLTERRLRPSKAGPKDRGDPRKRNDGISYYVPCAEGFRELTQDWSINIPARRRFNANYARIAFVLMLYSAGRIMRMKDKAGWLKERERIKLMLHQNLLGGLNAVIYTQNGHLGLFQARQHGDIVRRAERSRIKAMARAYQDQGRDLEDLLAKIEP
jgi:hypothetical protein